MRLPGICSIYVARLGSRTVLVQEAFAILGIAVGVALLFASQVSSASLTQAVAQLNRQLVGSTQLQLQARGPEGVSEQLLHEVRHVSGIAVALPVLERQVNVIGPRGQRAVVLFGVEPQAVRASGVLLRRFSARQIEGQRAIALPTSLAGEIGARSLTVVTLQFGGTFVETLVGATLGGAQIGGLEHSPVAITSLSYAQRLLEAHERLNRVFIRYDPAHAVAVRSELATLAARWHVNLLPATFDTRLFAVAVAPQSLSLALFSSISALVGFMFALNAILITVPSRRRLIKDLRPHGATQLMTIEILLFDTAVIGVLACAVGLALGDFLSIAVFHTTPGYLTAAFPVGDSRIVTWQTIALAIVAGMVAAAIGVFWPLLETVAAGRERSGSMHHDRTPWMTVRLIGGTGCLAISALTVLAKTEASIVGNVTLVIALILLLPFFFDLVVALAGRVSLLFNGVGSALAATELNAPHTRVRSLSIAATAAVAVLGIVEFGGTQANLQAGLDASGRDLDDTATVWVTPRGDFSLFDTYQFKGEAAQAISRLPGVREVGLYRGSWLNWGDRRLEVRGQPAGVVQPIPPSQYAGHELARASDRVRQGGWAVLSKALAAEYHLQVGQRFTLPSPRPIALRLAGLTTNLGWPPGAVILNSADYSRAWLSSEPSAFEIQTAAGASAARVRDLARGVLGAESGLMVETAGEREQRHFTAADQGLSSMTQIRVLVLIAAILAIVGALASMIWQRKDRIAAWKCHGYREPELWRWLLCESAVLLIAGCAVGALFGLCGQLFGTHYLGSTTGFPIVFKVEGAAAITSFGLVSAIGVLMLSIPGYLVVRVPPRAVSPGY